MRFDMMASNDAQEERDSRTRRRVAGRAHCLPSKRSAALVLVSFVTTVTSCTPEDAAIAHGTGDAPTSTESTGGTGGTGPVADSTTAGPGGATTSFEDPCAICEIERMICEPGVGCRPCGESQGECPGETVCDMVTGHCTPCNEAGPDICMQNDPAAPWCDGGVCSPCTDEHCFQASLLCSEAGGHCFQCSDLPADEANEACESSSPSTPICRDGHCDVCRAHEECDGSRGCDLLLGRCMDSNAVFFVPDDHPSVASAISAAGAMKDVESATIVLNDSVIHVGVIAPSPQLDAVAVIAYEPKEWNPVSQENAEDDYVVRIEGQSGARVYMYNITVDGYYTGIGRDQPERRLVVVDGEAGSIVYLDRMSIRRGAYEGLRASDSTLYLRNLLISKTNVYTGDAAVKLDGFGELYAWNVSVVGNHAGIVDCDPGGDWVGEVLNSVLYESPGECSISTACGFDVRTSVIESACNGSFNQDGSNSVLAMDDPDWWGSDGRLDCNDVAPFVDVARWDSCVGSPPIECQFPKDDIDGAPRPGGTNNDPGCAFNCNDFPGGNIPFDSCGR